MFLKIYGNNTFLIFESVSFNFKENINEKGQGNITIETNKDQEKNINILKKNKFDFYIIEILDKNYKLMNTFFIKNIIEKDAKIELIITDFLEILENDVRLDFSKISKEQMEQIQENNNPTSFLTFCFNEFVSSFLFNPFTIELSPINVGTFQNKKVKDLGEYEGQVIIVDFLKYIKTYLNYFNLVIKTRIEKNAANEFSVIFSIVKEQETPNYFLSYKNVNNLETKTASYNHAVASIKYNNFFDSLVYKEITQTDYNSLSRKKRLLIPESEDFRKRTITQEQENDGVNTYNNVERWSRLEQTNKPIDSTENIALSALEVFYIKRGKNDSLESYKNDFSLKNTRKFLSEYLKTYKSNFIYLKIYAFEPNEDSFIPESFIYKLTKQTEEANNKYYKVVKIKDYKQRPELKEIHYYLTYGNEIIKKDENNEKIDLVHYPLKTIIKEENYLAEAQIKAVYELYKNKYLLGATFKDNNIVKEIGDKVLFYYKNTHYILPITEIETKQVDKKLVKVYSIGNKRQLLTEKIKEINNKIIKNSVVSNENEQNQKIMLEIEKKEKHNSQSIKNIDKQITTTTNIVNTNKQKIQELQDKVKTGSSATVSLWTKSSSIEYNQKVNLYSSNETISPSKVVGAYIEVASRANGSSWNTVKSATAKYITPLIIAQDTTVRSYNALIENGDSYFSNALIEVYQYSKQKANDLYITLKRVNRTQSSNENNLGAWSVNVMIFYIK